MKDLTFFSLKFISFILIFLKIFLQNICSCICFALLIFDLKKIPKKLLGLANLFKAQIFYIIEAINIIVIYKHKNLIFITF